MRQREMWASFAPTAVFTTPVAAHLVEFAGVKRGETVLDVATGTRVVAITAARAGRIVTGLDPTPALLDVARENAEIAKRATMQWFEGDIESLPFPDGRFDVVLERLTGPGLDRAQRPLE
jgi:ubiquinone/menaquinone biosynthesis C-methylase UbiE